MSIILALALPIALLAAAGTWGLTRLAAQQGEHREQRRADRATAAEVHAAGLPRTLREVIERDGLGAAVEMTIHRGRSWVRQLELDGIDLAAEETRTRTEFEDGPKDIIERQGSIPRGVLLWICSILFVVVSVLLFLLVHGVLLVLLDGNDNVAAPLALVDVIFAAVLGILIHESLSPTGAIPAWTGTPLRDRAPYAVGLIVLLGFFLAISVILAPARSDEVHGTKVARAQQSCDDARSATTDEGSVATTGATVACERARTMQANLERSQLWDRAAAVLLPLAEIVLGAFALDLLILQAARRSWRRLERAEEDVAANDRAIASTTDLVIDELVEEAVRAGFTVSDVDAHLAAAGVQPPARPAPPVEAEPDLDAPTDADPDVNPGAGADAGAGAGAEQPANPRNAPLGDYLAPDDDGDPVRHDDGESEPAPADHGVPQAV